MVGSLTKTTGEPEVKPYKPGLKYVAVSNALSDGIENPFQNTLPGCQLSRLYSLLRDLDHLTSGWTLINRGHVERLVRRLTKTSCPFWIDVFQWKNSISASDLKLSPR